MPTREASEHCPLIGRPGIFEILCWEGLNKGKTEEELYAITEKAFKRSPEQARQIIQKAITGLVEKGYLIEVEEPSPLKQFQNFT